MILIKVSNRTKIPSTIPKIENKKANTLIIRALALVFADWTGLEPATSAVTGRHSNQLNYQSVLLLLKADAKIALSAAKQQAFLKVFLKKLDLLRWERPSHKMRRF